MQNKSYMTQYMRRYTRENTNRNRPRAYALYGGKCELTGTTENLNFAHMDPSKKSFNIAPRLQQVNFFSRIDNLVEMTKCALLCVEAHNAYDKTWTSLGYPQNEAGYSAFFESYSDWIADGSKGTYRKYLIANPMR